MGEIHDGQDVGELHVRLLSSLRRHVHAENLPLNEIHPEQPRCASLVREVPAGFVALWKALGQTNPFLQRYLRTGDGRPCRFSDVATQQELAACPRAATSTSRSGSATRSPARPTLRGM